MQLRKKRLSPPGADPGAHQRSLASCIAAGPGLSNRI